MPDQAKTPEELAAEEAAAVAVTENETESEEAAVTETSAEESTSEGTEEIDYLSMSDEEIANMDAPKEPTSGDESEKTENSEQKKTKASEAPKTSKTSKEETSSENDETKQAVTDPLQVEVKDAVAAYKQIFAPFKANNKDVQVRTPEEAIRLMQMGAGFMRYKKRIEPLLTRAQTLENAGIDSNELNFLIELKNKKPEAIKKLVRDAGLDPYDIATDEAAKAADKNYRPGDYSASSTQITLRDTLETTRSMKGGTELLNDLRTSWDDNSRQMALEDPAIISALAQQKEAGIYDQITAEIDRRLILGQLTNEPFLHLYHKVGVEMTENGMFTEATNTPGAQQKSQVVTTPKTKEVLETRTVPPAKTDKAAKAAAALAPVSAKPTSKVAPEAVLNMSDEEFEKLDGMERFV